MRKKVDMQTKNRIKMSAVILFVFLIFISYNVFFRNDEVEPNNQINSQMINSSSAIKHAEGKKNEVLTEKDVDENIHDRKIVTFMLPKWILPLFLAMLIANILSLFI